MPESYANSNFKDGKCVFCRNHESIPKISRRYLGEGKLLELLISRKNKKYDCVVPISGGKDSSYVLLFIAQKLKLKPLAVFFDNGFSSDIGKRNVLNLCRQLNVDLSIGKATVFRKKFVEEALYASKYIGKFIGICANCENNNRTFVINEALRKKIPFIVWGSTDFEDSAKRLSKHAASTFRSEFGTIKSMFRSMLVSTIGLLIKPLSITKKCRLIFHNFKHILYCSLDNIQMNAPEGWKKYFPFLEVSFRRKKIEIVYFFDFIKYDPFEQIEILKKNGWRSVSKKEAKLDCVLHCFGNYNHLKENGITSDGAYYATLVRNGLLTRSEALEKEKAIKKSLKHDCMNVIKQLDIDINEKSNF
jgi:3'-phosphoadenosine 5'-phosphosulfate sulfotransferase (PAPS reductase)/FAD synthetase